MAQKRTLLVTGASGLLGGRLAVLLGGEFHVLAGRHRAPVPEHLSSLALDITDPAGVARTLDAARPDAVLHSAALADADACQAQADRADLVNRAGSEHVARACATRSIRLVALSTDLVLGGDRAFSSEADLPVPRLVYGATKLAGEEATLGEAPGAAVARVALAVGGGHGPRATASEAIGWALGADRALRLYTDQYRTPVGVRSVARALAVLLAGEHRGIFHLGGAERLSRHELGLRVAGTLGLRAEGIEAVTLATQSLPAPRPADTSLDSSRARRELGWEAETLEAAIRDGRRRSA